MEEKLWSGIVSVIDGKNIVFDIKSVRQAAEFLILHWPDAKAGNWKHLSAQVACLDVLEGRRDPAHARQAFIEAAKEAGILAP